jgi:YD repeat-containing protein
MNRKVFSVAVWLCAIIAGPVLAGNERQPVFEKVRHARTAQLRTAEAEVANLSLRSTLEAGHNKPDSAIVYRVDGDEQSPYTKRVFAYAGDVINETTYGQDRNGVWNDLTNEEEYTFDTYGNLTLHIDWRYSDGELSWAGKEENAYNPNSTPLYERLYVWEYGRWAPSYYQTYQYDASGMLTGGTYYDYYTGGSAIPMTVSGTLENMEQTFIRNGAIYIKYVHHYDPATMKLLGKETFYANEATGVLEAGRVDEYTYDAAGRLLTDFYYYRKDDYSKTEYTYDVAGHLLSRTSSDAKSKTGPFTVSSKKEYEYAGGRLAKTKWWYDGYDGLGVMLKEVTVFYYDGSATGNEPVRLAEVSVYPNPVTDVLTVSGVQAGVTLTVVSLSGHTVLRQTLADTQTTLSVSSLPSGIYFVTVRSDKGTATFKIIKK